MHAANKAQLALVGFAAAITGCRQAPSDHNVAVENQAAAPTEIEALPPDDSAAGPTNELANGDEQAANVAAPSNSN